MYKKIFHNKHLIFAGKLFIIAVSYYYLYHKLFNSEDFKNFLAVLNNFSSKNWMLLTITLFLMPVNWLIESQKWRKLLEKLQAVPLLEALKAILSGISVGVFTPNRIGEIAGRLIVLPKEKWHKGIFASAYGGLAQFMVTVMAGSAGFLFLSVFTPNHIFFNHIGVNQTIITSTALMMLMMLVFFKLNFWVEKLDLLIPKKLKGEFIHYSLSTTIITFIYSLGRYAVFLIQFYLLLHFFDVHISLIESIWSIALTYLVTTIIPTSTLIELGIRGAVAVFFLGMFSNNHAGILSASILLWVINIAIPAVSGSILFLKSKAPLTSASQHNNA